MIKNCTNGDTSNQFEFSKEFSRSNPDLLACMSIDEKEAVSSDSETSSVNPGLTKPLKGRLGLELSCVDSKQVNKNLKHYTFENMTLKDAINEGSGYNRSEITEEKESGNIEVKKNFNLSRDYSFTEEPYENWSFIENRPHDSLSRQNLLGALESLEGFSYSNSKSVGSTSRSQKLRYEEQLMGDDIQQVYASRLEFQQKIK